MPNALIEEVERAGMASVQGAYRDRMGVAILAAYPSARAGLATLLQIDPAIAVSAIPPLALRGPDGGSYVLPGSTEAILVDPGDVSPEILQALATLSRAEDVPVVWLGYPDHGLPQAAGPANVISPDVEAPVLIAALRAAAAGLLVSDPNLAGVTTTADAASLVTGGPLSPREQEVLQLVAAGLPNKAIARELGISDHTVKFHVSSLLTKLDAGSRTEAVTIATRRGLLFL
jgi:DNA-binding NarL/FixJ family response regulator